MDLRQKREEPDDPLARELARLWRAIRWLIASSGVVVLLIVLAASASLYLRSEDLERRAAETNAESVRSCFRSSNQRPELRAIANDEGLPESVRGFVQKLYENTPTVADCRRLADDLNIAPPGEAT